MRKISASAVTQAVRDLTIRANTILGEDVIGALKKALSDEISPLGKEIIQTLIQNAAVAAETGLPTCQDTGMAVVFVDMGSEVMIEGGELEDVINEGVRRGYADGYCRNSVVEDPVRRINTGDNTPAVIHCRQVPGDRLRIRLAAKGSGNENMSRLGMLTPADGLEGLKSFVVRTVIEQGANACPPLVIGVGAGGNFEHAPLLAKKALLRPLGQVHPDSFWASVEAELLETVNRTGIGPMGLGGRITALAVHIETFPCHIASLPVAVNLNCHAYRHGEVTL